MSLVVWESSGCFTTLSGLDLVWRFREMTGVGQSRRNNTEVTGFNGMHPYHRDDLTVLRCGNKLAKSFAPNDHSGKGIYVRTSRQVDQEAVECFDVPDAQ